MTVSLRRERTKRFVEALWARKDQMVDAIVSDGWPRKMTHAGLAMHRKSWDVETIAQGLEEELSAVQTSAVHRLVWPSSVHHIWPALPGAGLTPVLVAMLLDIPQAIRPSSRGTAFAQQVKDIGGPPLVEPGENWRDTDLVVVSGTDETLQQIRQMMSGRGRVVGYGHRVSFALVVDDKPESVDVATIADALATDVVMWRQSGCFSVRAVLFCGSKERRRAFCRNLARAIGRREREWGADDAPDVLLQARAQALGVAQMRGEVFCEGIGFVRCEDAPFTGRQEAINSVTVHSVDDVDALQQVVDIAAHQIQGVALAGAWRTEANAWIDTLARLGATRIAEPGTMQCPSARWWHDGRPNGLDWARVVTVESHS